MILEDISKNAPFRWIYSHINASEYLKYDDIVYNTLKDKDIVYTYKLTKQKGLPTSFDGISGIYILFNRTNNVSYVGQSGNVYRRYLSHKSSTLKRALNAGDDLIIKVICLSDNARHFWERWFIKYYQLRYKSCNNSNTTIDNISNYHFEPHKEDVECQENQTYKMRIM